MSEIALIASPATSPIQTKTPPSSREVVVFPLLESVTSPTVSTAQAAHYLNRQPQTLRIWAMGQVPAPIRPLNIGGRLAWPVAELRRLLGVPNA